MICSSSCLLSFQDARVFLNQTESDHVNLFNIEQYLLTRVNVVVFVKVFLAWQLIYWEFGININGAKLSQGVINKLLLSKHKLLCSIAVFAAFFISEY